MKVIAAMAALALTLLASVSVSADDGLNCDWRGKTRATITTPAKCVSDEEGPLANLVAVDFNVVPDYETQECWNEWQFTFDRPLSDTRSLKPHWKSADGNIGFQSHSYDQQYLNSKGYISRGVEIGWWDVEGNDYYWRTGSVRVGTADHIGTWWEYSRGPKPAEIRLADAGYIRFSYASYIHRFEDYFEEMYSGPWLLIPVKALNYKAEQTACVLDLEKYQERTTEAQAVAVKEEKARLAREEEEKANRHRRDLERKKLEADLQIAALEIANLQTIIDENRKHHQLMLENYDKLLDQWREIDQLRFTLNREIAEYQLEVATRFNRYYVQSTEDWGALSGELVSKYDRISELNQATKNAQSQIETMASTLRIEQAHIDKELDAVQIRGAELQQDFEEQCKLLKQRFELADIPFNVQACIDVGEALTE